MIDALRAYLSPFPHEQKTNALREYLQWMILQILDEGGHRSSLVFTGGTCLRVVYGIGRFSEDLDFSRVPNVRQTRTSLNKDLLMRLNRRGLSVEVSSPDGKERAVASTWIQFQNLLSPLGLSAQKNQKLSVKLEIDQSPPQGGTVEEFFRPEPLPFLVNHFDLPSLFATKAHALLFRGFDKGRDYYDLLFFLGRKVRPHWTLFQNAVKQTHPHHSFLNPRDLWEALKNKILKMDEHRILQDVRPFLLKPQEERFLKKDVLLLAIQQAMDEILP